jgi:hypothetical protein
MIPIDRETMTIIATIVCIAGVIFLFKELNKAKQDVDELKVFSAHVVRHLSQPSRAQMEKAKKEALEEEVSEEVKTEE